MIVFGNFNFLYLMLKREHIQKRICSLNIKSIGGVEPPSPLWQRGASFVDTIWTVGRKIASPSCGGGALNISYRQLDYNISYQSSQYWNCNFDMVLLKKESVPKIEYAPLISSPLAELNRRLPFSRGVYLSLILYGQSGGKPLLLLEGQAF